MPERTEVLLRARGLCKVFPDAGGEGRQVLDGIDLEVRRQSLVVIRGESGCGKSTLLRILGLVDHEFEGELELCGKSVRREGVDLSARESEALRARHLGFIFQDDLLLPLLTLEENGELPARIHRMGKKERQERLGWLRNLMFRREELADGVMGRRRTTVSGGQRQRAAILRAFSHGPDLVLADEPTASLDPSLKQEVIDLFTELCEAGATIVVASHDSVFQEAGEIYELADGKLLRVKGAASEKQVEIEAAVSSFGRRRDARVRGCPPDLQFMIAIREALGNPLFALMIVAAMAAGLFQLTMLWSVQAGTDAVLDQVINRGSRLDRIEVEAKSDRSGSDTGSDGLPTEELLESLDGWRATVGRREIMVRMQDSRGRERRETAFGLVPDDPEIEKLEMREGMAFENQDALQLLITERSVERLFGADAVGQKAAGRRVDVVVRRVGESDGPLELEDVVWERFELAFVVQGVVDRAEAGRNLYLPQATLRAIATWQMDPKSSLIVEQGRLRAARPSGEAPMEPDWERSNIYFESLADVLPAASSLERSGFAVHADLYRYKWVLDTRRFVSWAIGGIVAMVMSIAGLLIVSNVVSSVRLKRKEIAVLKLMGMKDGDVVSILVMSVLLCSLLGGALGFGAGSLVVEWLMRYLASGYPDSPLGQVLASTWHLAPLALLFAAIVAVVFTVYPAWRTARKEAVWTID